MRAVSWLALTLVLGAGVARAEDAEDGWARPGYERVKVARAERPITTPKRTFDIYVNAIVRAPSPTEERFFKLPIEERGEGARLGLRYGTLYGVTDDFEVGLLFPPMVFRKGIEFDGPMIELTWRVLDDEVFELALAANAVIPIANDLGVGGRVPLRVRLTPALRLDVVPSFEVVQRDQRGYANGALPVTLLVQLDREWSAAVTAGVSTLGFETAAMSAGAEVAYTVSGQNGATADVTLGFVFPTLVDGSGRGTFVETSHWALTVGARFFVRLPQDRGGDF